MKVVVHHDLTNSVQDFRLLDEYEAALRDLLHFYDLIRGAVGHGEGWTAADVLRLGQIRAMVYPDVVIVNPNSDSRPLEAHSKPNGSGKPFLSKKAPSKLRASRKPHRRSPGLSPEG